MRTSTFRTLRPLAAVSFVASGIAAVLAVACASAPEPKLPPPTTATPIASTQPPSATETATVEAAKQVTPLTVDKSAMDPSVNACDDFYQYACGGWIKATAIPDDQARWSRSFDVLFEKDEIALRAILEADAAGKNKDDAYAKALGDFYASCMDEDAVEKTGTAPLDPELKKIAEVKDAASLSAEIAHLHTIGVGALFDFDATQDFKDATQVIGDAGQGGIGLPDRDYYVKDDAKTKDTRAKYVKHVEATLTLLDANGKTSVPLQAASAAVMKIETDLAKASMTKIDRRDPKKVYHRLDRKGLKAIAPAFGWDAYLDGIGAKDVQAINVEQPEFFKEMNALLVAAGKDEAKWNDLRTYLRWHLVRALAPRLTKTFVDEDFNFKRDLTGAAKILPRWKRCVRAVDSGMGEALARPFVKEALGVEGKKDALEMIGAIEAAMHDNLDVLAWMDPPTREKALAKLSKITNKIGYPDKWRNYDALTIDRGSYVANVLAADAFEMQRRMNKIGKPLDRGEWQMTPPTVNAYYDASMNEMVFPAGILQPPFYAARMVPAMAFGAIGMVMGHELTHGFDDEGRQFDGDGNLKEWWSPKVGKEFDKRADCVAKQYDEYTVLDGLHLKGKLTLGENIADLGGLKLAHAALAKRNGAKDVDASGFTAEQEFFLGYAQGWCTKIRDEALRLQVQTNPHSPSNYRVNGPLSNLASFAEAFKCAEGSKMVRPAATRCEIW